MCYTYVSKSKGGIFMANDYTDKFEGDPYFIKKGEQLSAAGMTKALNTKEKVANKTTTISNSSTDAQYPSAKAVYDTFDSKQDKLPIGTILMYDGANWLDNVTLPGWYCCDRGNHNKNATIPNLEDLFIKGKGIETQPGANWRELSETNLPSHKHSITDNGHSHSFSIYCAYDKDDSSFVGKGDDRRAETSGFYTSKSYTGITETNTTGSGAAFNNMPAYYALIYIKRIS
jgi:hypothetical protein